MLIVGNILFVIQSLVSLAFIAIVAAQTTKNEGLTGTIGGPVSSNFKGKPGFDEQLQQYTKILGVTWFVLGIVLGVIFGHLPGVGR